MDHALRTREKRVRQLMDKGDLNALIMANPENLQYLLGITEPSVHTCGVLVIPKNERMSIAVLWHDMDAVKFLHKEIQKRRYTNPGTQIIVVADILKGRGIIQGRMGADDRAFAAMGNALGQSFPEAEIVNASEMMGDLRWIKSEEELQLIRKACEIADHGMKTALAAIKPGVTELEIAMHAEQEMITMGGDASKHRAIVASGSRTLYIHPFATRRRIEKGDLVIIDLGAVYRGYCSDVARSAFVGSPPQEVEDAFGLLLNMQEALFGALFPGISMKDLTRTLRKMTRGTGWSLISPMGHGIGLKVEERPWLSMRPQYGKLKIEENMTLAFFSGSLQARRSAGVRLEDTVVVTAAGANWLTNHPRGLFIVPLMQKDKGPSL